MFDPHLVVEMFVFDSEGHPDDRAATARGQTLEESVGEATDDEALDRPSASGQ